MTSANELLQKFSMRVLCGVYFTWCSYVLHVQGEKGRNFIDLEVIDVRFDTKKLPTLLGAFWELLEAIWGQTSVQRWKIKGTSVKSAKKV